MFRGDRSLGFAALIALVFISFGFGAFTIALGYPEQQQWHERNQSSDNNKVGPLATVTNLASASMQHTPCEKPQTEAERDLCEQWRAANAAEKSAEWTVFGVLASMFGISLLLWQIMLTREAVKDTGEATKAMREANEIARRIGEAQVRCYISVVETKAIFTLGGFVSVICSVKNNGQSPGQKLHWSPELILYVNGSKIYPVESYTRDAYSEIGIAAGAIEELDRVNFKLDVRDIDFTGITDHDWLLIGIDSNIFVEDVFGEPRQSIDRFIGRISGNLYGMGWIKLDRVGDIIPIEET